MGVCLPYAISLIVPPRVSFFFLPSPNTKDFKGGLQDDDIIDDAIPRIWRWATTNPLIGKSLNGGPYPSVTD